MQSAFIGTELNNSTPSEAEDVAPDDETPDAVTTGLSRAVPGIRGGVGWFHIRRGRSGSFPLQQFPSNCVFVSRGANILPQKLEVASWSVM